MVAMIHASLDRLAIAWAGVAPHHALQWVPPPVVNPDIPLGDPLPEPDRLAVVWPRESCNLDVAAPTPFLEAPNHQLRLRWWPTAMPRRGSVILVPPWKMEGFRPLMPIITGLARNGFDVVGYPTPYHFERTPPGVFSGEYFATWDTPRTGWAIRAAVLELCSLVESLRARGPVALLGLSLGGYLSAMTSVVAPLYPSRNFTMDRLALVVPPGSILDTLMNSPVGERYKTLLRKAGGEVPDPRFLYELSLPFTPSRFRPCIAGEDILVVAGRHDAVVPVESSRKLAAGFGARYSEYEAGHLSGLVFTYRLWRDVGNFLSELPVLRTATAADADGNTEPAERMRG